MALSGAEQLEAMRKGLHLFADDVQRIEKMSRSIAENFSELHHQTQNTHRSFTEYLAQNMKLPPVLKEASRALITSKDVINETIKARKDELREAESIFKMHKRLYDEKRKSTTADKDSIDQAKVYKKLAQENLTNAKNLLDLEQKRLVLRESISAVTGKHLAIEYMLIKGFAEAIKKSGELNQSLIQANSMTSVRDRLTKQIFEVQAKTGASFETMNAAARSLTDIWPKAHRGFKESLEVMVEMEEGLGVSFEHSAQLARIFQVNLKVNVREVADQIAVIANNTSLAADEATRFATEIGKALRLLGPGAAPGAREAAGYVTMMAARMKDVGGDAGEVVKLFNEMTKGSQQAFMLRGLSGVNTPGALGSGQGAQQALQGLGRFIDKIVTARPGTMAYTAQLEAAAQVIGTSTETVRLYKDMIAESNKPLDEHAKLQQRWREQVTNANKALGRLEESFVSLIQQAFMPLLPAIRGLFGYTAQFVSFLASHKTTVYIFTGIVVAAAARTTFSLMRLAVALYEVAAASAVATRMQGLKSGGGILGGGGLGSLFSGGGLASSVSKLVPLFSRLLGFLSSPAFLVVAAGAAGFAIGRVIDKKFPDNIIAKWSRALAVQSDKFYTANVVQSLPGQKTAFDVMAEVRKKMLQGNFTEAERIFRLQAFKVQGMNSEKAAEGYMKLYKKTAAEVRERIALTTVTSNEKATLEHDRQMIELTKQQLENTGGAKKLLKDANTQRDTFQAVQMAETHKDKLAKSAQFRMLQDKSMIQKGALAP